MGLTVSAVERSGAGGNRVEVYGTVAFDNNYPTGGEVLDPAAFGLNVIEECSPSFAEGYVTQYDKATGKLLVFMGDNDGVADGPLVQANSTRDLSGLDTVRVKVRGW